MSGALRLTRRQVREVDRRAIEVYGMAGIVLMENAGRNATQVILQACGVPRHAVIVAGPGNNGGDGFVIARHLANHGAAVAIVLACDPARLTGDALANHSVAAKMNLPCWRPGINDWLSAATDRLARCDVVIDALLGTGSSGAPRFPIDAAIRAINSARAAAVIAVDVPSGLDCDTGLPADPTVRADHTITFVASKVGFDRPEARPYLGGLHVVDIGAPGRLVHEVADGGSG